MFGVNDESPISDMRIELIEPSATKHRNAERIVSVQKNGRIVFGEAGKRLIGVDVNEYVLIGQVGGNWYVAKRPDGSFKGYKIISQKGKNKHVYYIQSKSLLPLQVGEYRLGTAVNQDGAGWHMLVREA